MPFRAFGLFRHRGQRAGGCLRQDVLMPFRAFGLFRRKESTMPKYSHVIGLNALPGVRSIPTDTVTNAERNKIKRLNALPGVRSIPT